MENQYNIYVFPQVKTLNLIRKSGKKRIQKIKKKRIFYNALTDAKITDKTYILSCFNGCKITDKRIFYNALTDAKLRMKRIFYNALTNAKNHKLNTKKWEKTYTKNKEKMYIL